MVSRTRQNVLDFAETEFPSGHDLAAKVTITVDGYFGVFAEAATYAKALQELKNSKYLK